MHAAPAVCYPVGRSPWAARLLLLASLGGALGVVTSLLQSQTLAGRQALAVLVWGVTTALAVWGWRRTPSGQLSWDTSTWRWLAQGEEQPVSIELALDFQTWLLLRLRSPQNRTVAWVWPDRRHDPMRWHALRRALVAHPSGVTSPQGDGAMPTAKSGEPA